jgi:drug/metabolite transporter (DMT)-like permease
VPASSSHSGPPLLWRGTLAILEIVLGVVLVVAGVVMLVTPGPGVFAIIGGLALLSRHLPWLRRRVEALRQRIDERIEARRNRPRDGPPSG